ncbi:MAG: 30S ribosome-binding factor RbfA [Candidatus Omnitrophota bacterium]
MSIRSERVEGQLKKEISRILQEDLNDPRIGFVTVTRIQMTPDLRNARIYFSILGDEAVQQSALEGIESAKGYIRKLIADRMKMRYVPEIVFKLDNSIEYSINLEKTFEKLKKEHEDDKDSDKKI